MKTIVHGIAATFFLILGSVAAGFGQADFVRKPDRMVDIGTAKIFLNCTGKGGSPTVVIEAGAGAWSIHWRKVQSEVSKTNRVCTYDRAGLGKSTSGKMPRTAKQAALDLEQVLSKSNEPGPYVLVGHSYGGWVIRIFRDAYPERVAGMVLVDSAHHAQWEKLPMALQMVEAGISGFKTRFDALNSGKVGVESFPSGLPAPLKQEYYAALKQESMQQAFISELESSGLSAKQAGETKALGSLPLMVLSAGNSFAAFIPDNEQNKSMLAGLNSTWMEMQNELATLSKGSEHLISRNAHHSMNQDSPFLVAYSILLLTDKVKNLKEGKR